MAMLRAAKMAKVQVMPDFLRQSSTELRPKKVDRPSLAILAEEQLCYGPEFIE